MTEIYLIRHTQAEGNRYRMMQGFWDGEVTEKGKQQIEALAQRFRDIPVDAVYSSDLKRACLTAEAAARWKKLPIQTRPELRELNIGPWEQRFFGNISWEAPELAERFLYDPGNWYLEGAETYREVQERAMQAMTEIAEENDGKTVVVVSHGVTTRCIMSAVLGVPISDIKAVPIFKNTAVTKLNWDGERFRAEYLNDDSHLPEKLRTSWSTTGDLRDEPFDPAEAPAYYEHCYADAWRAAHGNLRGYNGDIYYASAKQHHAENEGAVLRIFHRENPVGLMDMDPEHGAEDGIGWISLLYLKDSYRNKGYGIQLLARAIFFYKALGRSRLRLQVASENQMARAFYRREGFCVLSTQRSPTGELLMLERPVGTGEKKPLMHH